VLDLGSLEDFSSTTLKLIRTLHRHLTAAGSALVLTGVGPGARGVLTRTDLLTTLGEANVLPTDPHLGGSLEAGRSRGEALLEELRAAAPTG
jgi:hypothetical protein